MVSSASKKSPKCVSCSLCLFPSDVADTTQWLNEWVGEVWEDASLLSFWWKLKKRRRRDKIQPWRQHVLTPGGYVAIEGNSKGQAKHPNCHGALIEAETESIIQPAPWVLEVPFNFNFPAKVSACTLERNAKHSLNVLQMNFCQHHQAPQSPFLCSSPQGPRCR